MNWTDLTNYIIEQKKVTIPEVQRKFNATYSEVREAFCKLQQDGKIKIVDGIVFEWIHVEPPFGKVTVVDKPSDNANDIQVDPLCKRALRYWLEKQDGKASIASIQRNLDIGFNRSGRIVDQLQQLGYVSRRAATESVYTPLRVLVKLEDLDKLFPDLPD